MKLKKIFLKENVYDFVLIITLLITSLIGLEFLGSLPIEVENIYSARILNLIHLLKIDVATENKDVLLKFVYKRYIILFLGCGYLTSLILLTKLFHKTCKQSILYIGSLYFSLAIGFEILSYIIPFDNLRIFFTVLNWIFILCGHLIFLKYFWINVFNINFKVPNLLSRALILIAVIPLSMAIKDFYNIFLDREVVFGGIGLYIQFNYLKNIFLGLIIIFNLTAYFYNKDKNKKIESISYCCLFSLQLIFNIYIYDNLNLYGNFEYIAHFILNILLIHIKLEDIKLSTDNQFFRTVNFNLIRIFIIFLMISYFVKKTILTGYITIFIAIIILVEIVFFINLFFSEQDELNFDNFLNKLKGIETLSDFSIFLESEFVRIFRLVEFKVEIFDLKHNTKDYGNLPLINFSPVYRKKQYDLGIKIQNKDKLLGYIYAKDSCLLMYKRKLKNFKNLTLQIAPILENTILKNLQIEHYKGIEKNLNKKSDSLEKELFYIKELLALMDKVDNQEKKIEIAKILSQKINKNKEDKK